MFIVLDYLKENAVGKENAITGANIAWELNTTSANIRYKIKKLRVSQDLVIGATSKGYYIPRESEHKQAVSYSENKVLSHIETTLKQRPAFILTLYKALNEYKKSLPEAVNKQLKFNEQGDIVEVVRYVDNE